jgi:hypothetical protein
MKVRAPDNSIVEGTQVDFEETSVPWSTIKLKDGTTLKIKIQVLDVIRMDFYNPTNGDPAYFVPTTTIIRAVEIPNKLRKLPNAPPNPTNTEIQ